MDKQTKKLIAQVCEHIFESEADSYSEYLKEDEDGYAHIYAVAEKLYKKLEGE